MLARAASTAFCPHTSPKARHDWWTDERMHSSLGTGVDPESNTVLHTPDTVCKPSAAGHSSFPLPAQWPPKRRQRQACWRPTAHYSLLPLDTASIFCRFRRSLSPADRLIAYPDTSSVRSGTTTTVELELQSPSDSDRVDVTGTHLLCFSRTQALVLETLSYTTSSCPEVIDVGRGTRGDADNDKEKSRSFPALPRFKSQDKTLRTQVDGW
ncbi:hypothetical protein K456DRAFT_255220 [Colletotrichum gloeosporioides 23]|nr:hypothetical protein K456DRAFT_255220 [Colletotrichum gloeosporioides 23]